ncbi:MAG: hypothetical protein ACTSPI_08750, partial [Candidatus Heimdallarchaeaceae archaeon]
TSLIHSFTLYFAINSGVIPPSLPTPLPNDTRKQKSFIINAKKKSFKHLNEICFKVNRMNTQRKCKWKPSINARGPSGEIKAIEFPCRYPNEDLTSELCTQCLLGELFAMFYAQTMSMKQSMNMQEEMMAFLKSFTSEDWDLR